MDSGYGFRDSKRKDMDIGVPKVRYGLKDSKSKDTDSKNTDTDSGIP